MLDGLFHLGSLGEGVWGFVRLALAAFFVVGLFGMLIAEVQDVGIKILIFVGVVVAAISSIYFQRTYDCTDGYEDSDDNGRRSYTCANWVIKEDPDAREFSLITGALVALGLVMVIAVRDQERKNEQTLLDRDAAEERITRLEGALREALKAALKGNEREP